MVRKDTTELPLGSVAGLVGASVSEPSPSPSPSPTGVSYAYFGTFVALGMFAGILGPSIDVFKARTGSNDGEIAILFAVLALGYTVGGVLTGPLFDRRKGHPLVASGLAGAAVAVFAITQASTLLALGVLMALMGFATSAVDTGGNTLLTWLHGKNLGPWMIGLHAAFGVGSALTPLLLEGSRSLRGDINGGLVVMGVVSLAAAAMLLRFSSPTHRAEDRLDESVEIAAPVKPAPKKLALVVAAAFFFVYVGLEIGFAGWVYTFAKDHGFSDRRASALTSTFWWAFTAGRLLGIPVARYLSAKSQILVDVVVTLGGATVLWASNSNAAMIWVGTAVLGIGLATMFPAMINVANERVAVTGRVTSWFISGAGFGSAVLPWSVGRLFNRYGSGILPLFVLAGASVVAVVSISAARLFEAAR